MHDEGAATADEGESGAEFVNERRFRVPEVAVRDGLVQHQPARVLEDGRVRPDGRSCSREEIPADRHAEHDHGHGREHQWEQP